MTGVPLTAKTMVIGDCGRTVIRHLNTKAQEEGSLRSYGEWTAEVVFPDRVEQVEYDQLTWKFPRKKPDAMGDGVVTGGVPSTGLKPSSGPRQ